MRSGRVGVLRTLLLVATMSLLVVSSAASSDGSESTAAVAAKGGTYIVRLAENPVVAYDGGIAGYKATAPTKGKKIDPNDPDVVKYVGYLKTRHDAVLGTVGGAQKAYDYAYSFNGFAAKLTSGQVAALEANASVLSVEKTVELAGDTATTPRFLGLTLPGGLYSQGVNGEGVIIGISTPASGPRA